MSGFQELRDLGVTFRPFDGPSPPQGGRSSPFTALWSETVALLARELRHLEAKQVVVELGLDERDLGWTTKREGGKTLDVCPNCADSNQETRGDERA